MSAVIYPYYDPVPKEVAPMVPSNQETVAGLAEPAWLALCRRIENGLATVRDARQVHALGLQTQAIRIRQGLSTRTDAVLVHLTVQQRLYAGLLHEAMARQARGSTA